MEYFFSGEQWVDAMTRPFTRHLDYLNTSINGIIGKAADPEKPKITQQDIDAAKRDFEECTPDLWKGNQQSIFAKIVNFLFGDNEK